ncbi:methylenetetrahydrofolate reductase C-terminal domain-containing protein [Lentisphaerota bacterium WC36G]|nr:methylenetetrahydrofolate reductase C-terminal domain-containing protein [Lentisphaerae bacterium WC36]
MSDNYSRQLQMNFENYSNQFQKQLNSGNFSILFEFNTPDIKLDLNDSANRVKDAVSAVFAEGDLSTGVSFFQNYGNVQSHNPVEFGRILVPEEERSRSVIYLSGRGNSLNDMYENIELAMNEGFNNIIAASGCSMFNDSVRSTRKKQFTESIHLLNKVKNSSLEFKKKICIGTTFNPFKYNLADCTNQYFKLVKKINHGAQFIVTQFGWDMYKMQELRWYLTNRGFYYPSLAGILFLNPSRVEKIIAGEYRGVHISSDFRKVLTNELRFSTTQFEASQWRRLQLQVAGAKLLGYSGVQISGLDTPYKINVALRKIKDAFAEFNHFQYWRSAYEEYLGRVEMAPYPQRFYIFEKLLDDAHLTKQPTISDGNIPECTKREKIHYYLAKFLFGKSQGRRIATEHFISKKLFASCRSCKSCRLPQFHYLCPEICPKGFANGPCGGTKVDGKCEVANRECVHIKRLKLANWRGNVNDLEEIYLQSGKVRK